MLNFTASYVAAMAHAPDVKFFNKKMKKYSYSTYL
jgi:hypothetical protein